MERECAMQSRCGRESGGVSPSGQIRPTLPHLPTVDRLIPCQPGASADRESTADSSHLLVTPARVKFEVKLAEGLVLNKKWDELEEYLFRFLTDVEGDRKHSHPGLFYPLYEAYVSDLIVKGEVEKAEQVFKDKAEPQSRAEDYLCKPTDIELRVQKLKNIVSTGVLPPGFVPEKVRTAVVDYIGCYFPESFIFKGEV